MCELLNGPVRKCNNPWNVNKWKVKNWAFDSFVFVILLADQQKKLMAVVYRNISSGGWPRGGWRVACIELQWGVESLVLGSVQPQTRAGGGGAQPSTEVTLNSSPFSDVWSPQGSELRFLSDRCFLKGKIVPEPWGFHRLSRTDSFGGYHPKLSEADLGLSLYLI